MHRAGATVLEELLDAGKDAEREVTCRCGHQARFHEMRPKQILTALGCIQIQRPYYVCKHCHQGQSPRDRELDVEGTEYSPALRRMIALVGSEGSFEQGRQQLDQLAGLQVTTKAVERQAEAIGQDIAEREQANIERAVQLDLPEIAAQNISVMYIEMDGTGVSVVKAETEGREGKTEGQPAHTREVKLGCVFTQTGTDEQGRPVRDEASTSYTGAIETAAEFGRRLIGKLGTGAAAAPARRWFLVMALSGSGTSPTSISRAPFKSWISTMPGSICGNWPPSSFRPMTASVNAGHRDWRRSSTLARSKNSSRICGLFPLQTSSWNCWRAKPLSLNATPSVCATHSSALKNCSWVPVLSRLVAKSSSVDG